MSAEPWRRDFPGLEHEPQDLDLIRRALSWTPAERVAYLVSMMRFVERARRGRWLGPLVAAGEGSTE
jgi:hypothetical protein